MAVTVERTKIQRLKCPRAVDADAPADDPACTAAIPEGVLNMGLTV